MGFRLKLLVPLNLLIIVIWVVHTAWSMRILEHTMVNTEVEATGQLAFSLKLRLEQLISQGQGIEPAATWIGEMAQRWPGLDIMIIDPAFTVRLASSTSQVGERWYEPGIESVLHGSRTTAWNVQGHTHKGRRAIDASVGVSGTDGQVRYVVHIAKWLDRLLEAIRLQRRNALLLSLLELAAVTVAVNLVTLGLVVRPLKHLHQTIRASGWLGENPQLATGDEISHLSAVVGSLLRQVQTSTERLRTTLGEREDALQELSADRDVLADTVLQVRDELEDAEARLVRAERIAAQAQLSRALAHELRNPLHIIRATAETAGERSPEVAELTADIMEEVDRINGLITKVLAFTRPSDLSRELIDVGELLETVRQRMCRGLCKKSPASCELCTVTVEAGATLVDGDPVLLEQAIINLFSNAREASPEPTPIELTAVRGADGQVEVIVADHGRGIDERDRARVFEPFFTRRTNGVGLGLPAVQKIADLHGGSISLEARQGGGTVARLTLPAAGRPAAQRPAAQRPAARGSTSTVTG